MPGLPELLLPPQPLLLLMPWSCRQPSPAQGWHLHRAQTSATGLRAGSPDPCEPPSRRLNPAQMKAMILLLPRRVN